MPLPEEQTKDPNRLPEPVRTGYFPALTGIRMIAAWMVFFHHNGPVPPESPFFPFSRQLFLGVNMFFVLSGFLIYYRYGNRPQRDYSLYIKNRVARIFPIFFLLTTLTFAWEAWEQGDYGNPQRLLLYFLNITLLKGFFNDFLFTGIFPSWSLAVEETFYLLAPWSFARLRRNKRMLYLLPVFFLFIGLALYGVGQVISFYGFVDTIYFLFFYTFFGRGVEFFVGIALARRMLQGRVSGWRRGGKTILGIVLFIGWMYVSSLLLPIQKVHPTVFHLSRALVCNMLLPLTAIRLVYEGLLTERTWFSRLLSTPMFQLLGKSSYAFYLIHTGLIFGWTTGFLKTTVSQFVLLNVLSIALYVLVEAPVHKWLRRNWAMPRKG